AGRLLFIDEAHRDLHRDGGVLADAQEVDVDREVANRVELVGLGEDLDLLTIDVDRGDRGHEPAAVNLVVDVLVAQRDRERSLLVAVDDGGDFAVATQCTGGPLTDRIARLGLELVSLAHGISFRFKTGGFPGWPENAKPAVLGTADPPRAASKGVCT